MGRKRLMEISRMVTFLLDDKTYKQVSTYSKKHKKGFSATLRLLLQRGLEAEKKKQHPLTNQPKTGRKD